MRFNPFRKRRTVKSFTPAKTVFKNPFFNREKFTDVFFRTLKIHYGFIVLLIFGLVYLIFFSEIFQIHFIVVKGANKVPVQTIENYVKEELSLKRLNFLPQSNYYFFDEKSARVKVREKIEKTIALEEYNFKKVFPRTVTVTLKEAIPSLTWWNGTSYYYLSATGLVAQTVLENEVNKEYPLIEDLNKLSVSPQDQTVSAEWLGAISEIRQNLAKINLPVDHFIVPIITCYNPDLPEEEESEITLNLNANTNLNANKNINSNKNENLNENTNTSLPPCQLKEELNKLKQINVLTAEGYQIYLAADQDIAKQIENLNLVLASKLKGKTSTLKYIDLRFENRIYYQ
ncbi:MAG: hypothetical protein WC528_02625 [Patescibacteria group bacterium]